jgi:hypothetical protein
MGEPLYFTGIRYELMSANADPDERVLGTIIYAAISSGDLWNIQHVIFTDRRVVVVPFSSLKEVAERAGDIGGVGLMLAARSRADMGSINYGLSVRSRALAWHELEKKVAGTQIVSFTEEKLPKDLLKAATITIPYERIREVSLKKNWASGYENFNLNLKENLLKTHSWFLASSVDEVKALIQKTPLAPKLKQA